MNKLLLCVPLFLSLISLTHANHTQNSELTSLAPFPAAKNGIKRQVITLPHLDDESQHKVELMIGKKMTTDCNITALSGDFTEQMVEGWGYNYYQLTNVEGPLTTRMACPNSKKKRQFVTIDLPKAYQFVDYNSQLPIVIYTPKDIQVKYRIWRVGKEEAMPTINQEQLTAYPALQAGFKIEAHTLPTLKDENNRKIGLLFSKALEVDCNYHKFSAVYSEQMSSEGSPYGILYDVEGPISTMRACPDQGKTLTNVPIELTTSSSILDYNSQQPLVTYMPDDVLLQYQFWVAGNKIQRAALK